MGDSRADVVSRYLPSSQHNLVSTLSIPGAKTHTFTYKNFEDLPEDTELILMFLYQCDFTKKCGVLIKPNHRVNVPQLVEDTKLIEMNLKARCPQAYIFWTIPITRKFSVEEINSRSEVYDMCTKVRRLMTDLRENKIYFMDLSKNFKAGEHREAYDNRYTYDGIHPTQAGSILLFKQFRRIIVSLGFALKLIKKREEIIEIITYEIAEN